MLHSDKKTGILTVKIPNGEVYKIREADCIALCPQDDTGVEDILQLREFSEKSMIHTLRCRYRFAHLFRVDYLVIARSCHNAN